MNIFLGADHGGFELKEQVKAWLADWGYQFEDLGAFQHDLKDDYPDFTFPVAEKVAAAPPEAQHLGVLLCRTSAGMSMAANKVKGIRAASVLTVEEAQLTREKNNANIIALAGDYLNPDQAKEILRTFLETPFSEAQRHRRRLQKIADYEQQHWKGQD